MSIPAAPGRPIAAVLAVVIRDGRALLVRRANTPDAGLWGFPGGKIEPGEPILVAAERELHEETGVQARARGVITALDAFEAGALRRHFVLIAVECHWQAGIPVAADDALEAGWFTLAEMETMALSRDVLALARRAGG